MQQPSHRRSPGIICDEMIEPGQVADVLARSRCKLVIIALAELADIHVRFRN